VPPVKVTEPLVVATVPPQVVLGLPLTTTPLGNVSVSDAPVAGVASALLKVMVRMDVPPAGMVAGKKA
jgi:hypothetical protein